MKVSVLIASYNREKVLAECLTSLDNQTFRDFEIILVDDGSTDNTKSMADRVDVYHYKKHSGIADSFNKTLELMSGEYYFVIGSDDMITPDCLEILVKTIEETGADFVFPYYKYVGTGTMASKTAEYWPQTFEECYRLKKIPHAGLYRTSTLGHFRYDRSISSAVDYDYILTILRKYPKIKMQVVKKPLYHYRIGHKQERDTPAQIVAVGIIRNKHRV